MKHCSRFNTVDKREKEFPFPDSSFLTFHSTRFTFRRVRPPFFMQRYFQTRRVCQVTLYSILPQVFSFLKIKSPGYVLRN